MPPSTTIDPASSRARLRSARFAFYAQRYGFSALFFWAGYRSLVPATFVLRAARFARISLHGHGLAAVSAWIGVGPQLVLTLFNFSTGLLLLSMRPPARSPDRLVEIVVPIVATLLSAAYNFVAYLPNALNAPLMSVTETSMTASAALAALGWTISLSALWYLGRSFAVFVQAGELIQRGPYKYVRHPMYMGYLLVIAAVLVAHFSIATLALSAAQLCITVYRARLEEAKLLEAHAAYRVLTSRAGFLLPRVWRGHPRPDARRKQNRSPP